MEKNLGLAKKVSVIVFSKDRPMQLDCYLGSLLARTDIEPSQIHVVYVEDECYDLVWKAFPGVNRVPEKNGFHATLSVLVDSLDPDGLIFWGVDDVVFVRDFSFADIVAVMRKHPEVTGMGVVLGTAMKGGDRIAAQGRVELAEGVYGYIWKMDGLESSWGYPFDLEASAYRVPLVKQILNAGWTFSGPNELEAVGARMLQKKRTGLWRRINRKLRGKPPIPGADVWLCEARFAIFEGPSHAFAQDVNRVQDVCLNPVHGTEDHDADTLKRKYQEGWRIDWESIKGVDPVTRPVGDRYWKLKKVD